MYTGFLKALWLKNNSQKQEVNFTSYETKHRVLAIGLFVFFHTASPPPALRLSFFNKYLQVLAGSKKTSKGREMLVFDLKRPVWSVYTKPLAEFLGAFMVWSWFPLSSLLFICWGHSEAHWDLISWLGSGFLLEGLVTTDLLKSFIVSLAKGWGTHVYQFYSPCLLVPEILPTVRETCSYRG